MITVRKKATAVTVVFGNLTKKVLHAAIFEICKFEIFARFLENISMDHMHQIVGGSVKFAMHFQWWGKNL